MNIPLSQEITKNGKRYLLINPLQALIELREMAQKQKWK